ncbi:MAG: hypothetical protein HUK21_07320 [Fibrobacteraceae bacterium]|nr:hypothetical protein [Fibrobacteraceae bacterium]
MEKTIFNYLKNQSQRVQRRNQPLLDAKPDEVIAYLQGEFQAAVQCLNNRSGGDAEGLDTLLLDSHAGNFPDFQKILNFLKDYFSQNIPPQKTP